MRGVGAVVVLVAALGGAGPAQAAVVVTEPDGTQLSAQDGGGALCLTLREASGTTDGSNCSSPPEYAPDARLGAVGDTTSSIRYGVVPAEVAAVEAELADGRRVRADTVAGDAYRGRFAGRVRFALLELRSPIGDELIRYYDAAGNVIGASGLDQFGPPAIAPRPFARVPGFGTVVAFARRTLAPTPLQYDRTESSSCIGLPRRRGERFLAAESCADEGPIAGGVTVNPDPTCEGTLLTGITAPNVRAVTAVLGDGQRLRVPLRRLPSPLRSDVHAFVVRLGARLALVRLLASVGSGTVSVPISSPPGQLSCFAPSDFGTSFGAYGPSTTEAPRAAAPRLRLHDDGVRLCATLGGFDPFGADCALPPLSPQGSILLDASSRGRTLVALVGAPQVTAAAVTLAGSRAERPLPRDDAALSASRYRGILPVFALVLPGRRRVRDVVLTDTRGHHVREAAAGGASPAGRFVAHAGPLLLRATTLGRTVTCLMLARTGSGPLGVPACDFAESGAPVFRTAALAATCAPRRLVVALRLPRRARGLTVRLAGGGAVIAAIARIPRAAGGGRAAFAVVPPRGRPTRLVLPGTSIPARRVRIPPAGEECGWAGQIPLAG